jgi:hypothetical protein
MIAMLKLVMLALALGGCSFAIVRGPAQDRRDAPCTESQGAPAVDSLGVLLTGAVAFVGLSAHSPCTPDQDCPGSNLGAGVANTAGAVFLVAATAYAISAAYGFTTTSRCQRVHALPAPPPVAPARGTGAPQVPASL